MTDRPWDPYAPHEEGSMTDGRFRGDRWARAGAGDEQLTLLEQRHAAMDPEQQQAEATRVDGLADGDLTGELEHVKPSVAEKRTAHDEEPVLPLPAEPAADVPAQEPEEQEQPKRRRRASR